MVKVFVYGTMKQGFPLHDKGLRSAAFLGWYRTVQRYPMVVGGANYGPMMFNRPGSGLQVWGELYEFDEEQLANADEAEDMGKPGNYRTTMLVELMEGCPKVDAIVYTKSEELAQPRHSGNLYDYQDRRFIPSWAR